MTTTKKTSVTQILKRAKKLIEEGWVQGEYETEEGGKLKLCAIGALNVAAHNANKTKRDRALKVLHASLGGKWRSANDRDGAVISFNDHDGRRRADVLRLFDRAITAAENGVGLGTIVRRSDFK